MRALQLRAAAGRASAGRAARVPFYRTRWPRRVGGPSRRTLERPRASCPSCARTDLREQYPFGLFAVPLRPSWPASTPPPAPRASPPSSATPPNDLRRLARGHGPRAGRRRAPSRGDLIHIAYGYGLFTGGLGFHDGAEHMGCTVVPVSSGNTRARSCCSRTSGRTGSPARRPSRSTSPRRCASRGATRARSGCATASSAPSRGPRRCAPQLEALWGVTARATSTASQRDHRPRRGRRVREARDGLHVNEDHFLPEIVDPGSGEPLPAGHGRRARPDRA